MRGARPYRALGEYLREMRKEAGLRQLDVARELRYSSPQFVSNFECGISRPPLHRFKRLSGIYKFSLRAAYEILMECEEKKIYRELFK